MPHDDKGPNQHYPHLFAPYELAGKRLKNRIVHASVTLRYGSGREALQKLISYHATRARGGACQESIRNGATAGVAYDDPRSAFNGVERFIDVNSIRIDNRDGPAVWYTNPFGRGGRTEPFPGSVRQVLSKVNNSALRISGPGLGFDRFYGGAKTHAPNYPPVSGVSGSDSSLTPLT